MANDTTTGTTSGAGPLDVEFTPEQGKGGQFIGATADREGEGKRSARELVSAEAGKIGGQAGDKLRAFADDGKTRASSALDDVAKMISDAAGTLDDKVGAQFGGYARSASTAVADFSEKLKAKDVDDLVADAREFVKKSPGVAIGAAAAVGFLLARVLRSGVDANRDA